MRPPVNMRSILQFLLSRKTLIIALCAALVGGYFHNGLRHVSGKYWLEMAVSPGGSIDNNIYLGADRERAFFLRKGAIATLGQNIVYWTELSELPEPLASQLKAEYLRDHNAGGRYNRQRFKQTQPKP